MIHDSACTATDRGLVLRQHCNCGLDSDSQINHDQPDVANGVYVELGRGMQTFNVTSMKSCLLPCLCLFFRRRGNVTIARAAIEHHLLHLGEASL